MSFICHHCLYKTNIKYNIERHIRNIHLKNNSFDNNSKIICPICNSKWHLRKLLRSHLTDDHNISVNEEFLTFSSNAEFMAWKKATEIENCCQYVAKEGERKKSEVQIKYFYCHRDGIFQPTVAKRKRLLERGSNKIGSSCPSQIICRKTKEVIDVQYISTHCGHDSNKHPYVTLISLENIGDRNFLNCESNTKQVSDIEALTPFIEASNSGKENKKLTIIKSKYEAILGHLTSISTITDEEASILERKADQILTIVAKPHIEIVDQSKLAISNNEPASKNSEKQRRLFITKAKRKSTKKKLSIPTSNETANLIKFDHTYA